MSDTDLIKEIRDRYEFAKTAWQDIRAEAAIDMRYVAGDPWDDDDKKARKNRPTVAPEEMGQYFNQVINSLLANPRGMKFVPQGNGANDKGAGFYQNKAREIEYRSHAKIAYVTAATDAIQRSYGFCRVNTRYRSPRSSNQEIWIEPFPDPDMVLPDPEARRPDSSDMGFCFVLEWGEQAEGERKATRGRISNLGDFASSHPSWVQGKKTLRAEYWAITTRKRNLVLVQPPAPQMAPPARMIAPQQVRPPQPVELFDDEVPPGAQIIRDLRVVDFPKVRMHLTNGIEVLHSQDWPGKYIPIVSCYGKVLYVPEGGETKKKILSMTRFGRDPWKSYCYASSQQLEVVSQVPKAPVKAASGQLRDYQKDWEESSHVPKAFLLYHHKDEDGQPYPEAPSRLEYAQGDQLQALEMVKEGFRRAIQSAMGSNFLPTQAQRRNEKSGVALDKIEQAATQGTYHFVNSYEDMIRQVGVICEDLIDKIHDYMGDVDTIEADGKAKRVRINDPQDKDAVKTSGEYITTITTAPSSDSERDAADDFTNTLVGNLNVIAQVAGPKAAAAVLARSVRMRNLGPAGDQLADIIEPPEYKTQDGQPPSPELLAMRQQVQHLTELLQQAAQDKQAKVVETQGKFAIEKMKVEATSADKAADREVKMAVAELGAKMDRLALFLEESHLVGARAHEHAEAVRGRVHEALESTKDRVHDVNMAQMGAAAAQAQSAQDHSEAQAQADQGVQGQLAVQAAQPQPETTA